MSVRKRRPRSSFPGRDGCSSVHDGGVGQPGIVDIVGRGSHHDPLKECKADHKPSSLVFFGEKEERRRRRTTLTAVNPEFPSTGHLVAAGFLPANIRTRNVTFHKCDITFI